MKDVRHVLLADILGELKPKDIVQLSTEILSEPVDTDLLNLSLCKPDDTECIERHKTALMKNYGMQNLSISDALREYGLVISHQILDKEIDPLEGAEKISRVAINHSPKGFHDLDPFIYAASEVEDRPQDTDFFRSAVVNEARLVIERFEE